MKKKFSPDETTRIYKQISIEGKLTMLRKYKYDDGENVGIAYIGMGRQITRILKSILRHYKVCHCREDVYFPICALAGFVLTDDFSEVIYLSSEEVDYMVCNDPHATDCI